MEQKYILLSMNPAYVLTIVAKPRLTFDIRPSSFMTSQKDEIYKRSTPQPQRLLWNRKPVNAYSVVDLICYILSQAVTSGLEASQPLNQRILGSC